MAGAPGAAATPYDWKYTNPLRDANFFRSAVVQALSLLSTMTPSAALPTVIRTVTLTDATLVAPLSYRSPVETRLTVTLASGMPRHSTATPSSTAVLFSVVSVYPAN